MVLTTAILSVLGGFVLLASGGEVLVRGAVATARRLRVSPTMIGLTVVAMATSLPELAVTITAAGKGNPDVAVGNVVGSNIFNLAVILGVSAIFFPPLRFRANMLRLDILLMTAAGGLMLFFAHDSTMVKSDGIIFLGLLAAFLAWRARGARLPDIPTGEGAPEEIESELHEAKPRPLALYIVMILAGAGLLTVGAKLLVPGAITIADFAGISERVIALTLVSAGTGLPELATAIAAGRRGHSAVAVGNVIGSNIFNVFGIMGVALLIKSPIPIATEIISRDLWWMLGFSTAALVLVLRPSRSIPRIAGIVALAIYALYLTTLL